MMISNINNDTEAFVWIWLEAHAEPVVVGRLTLIAGDRYLFNYGKSYLERDDAIALYDVELPLRAGALAPLKGLSMPGCLRDAAPDAWGRRVILNRNFGAKAFDTEKLIELNELTYLLESGSDRIGALDFQRSPSIYEPRSPINASLDELLDSAERVERGIPLTPELDAALQHGTSIGGARPKALIENKNKKYVAKFSSSSDLYSIVKAEFIAMRLAKIVGLTVANVDLVQSAKKDVLLIERFDRTQTGIGWQRKNMLSALTLMELDEMMARYASYETLAEIIRHRFREASATLKELFARIIFNILSGNTDDHARNHAAFWDGKMLSLTPAYDICPQTRTGQEASQGMLISGNNRSSRISTCLDAAHHFLLSKEEAVVIVENQLLTIGKQWSAVCDLAQISPIDRALLRGRQFLNPYAFDDLQGKNSNLMNLAKDIRSSLN